MTATPTTEPKRRGRRANRTPMTPEQQELVRPNIALASKFIADHRSCWQACMTFDEALSFACLTLCAAARSFKPSMGFKFTTHAMNCLKYQFRMRHRDGTDLIHIPIYQRERDLRSPTVILFGDLCRGGSKFDEDMDHNGERVLDLLTESTEPDPAAELIEQERREQIDRCLRRLPARERDIIRRRFGLPPYTHEHTMNEIAAEIGRSRERVRQLVKRSLNRLKRGLKAKGLDAA